MDVTRRIGGGAMAVGMGGRSMRGILGEVGGRADLGFFCSPTVLDGTSSIALGIGSVPLRRMLGVLSIRAKLGFRQVGGAVSIG